jgi:colanic acid/amylovoran biosynthesis protein
MIDCLNWTLRAGGATRRNHDDWTGMRVHVLGSVALNGGDAAIMAGQEAMLRRQWPDVAISVSDSDPEAAARYYPQYEFHPFLYTGVARYRGGRRIDHLRARLVRAHWFAVAYLHGRGADRLARRLSTPEQTALLAPLLAAGVIAYTGGTSLTENYDLKAKLFDLQIAALLGRTLVFLPQSAGPFRRPDTRSILRQVFRAADLVLVRDSRSHGYVLDVGAVPERSTVLPDMAFALVVPPADWPARNGHAPKLAVSVRSWSHFDGLTPEEGMRRYTEAVQEAVTRVVRTGGAEVSFVSTCQGRPEYWTDDSALAVDIAAGLDPDVQAAVTVDREARTPPELLKHLAGFDAMLSTRLHGAILATCAGVPTLPIAYEFKTREVWGQLGLDEWVIDIGDVDRDGLADAVIRLLERRVQVRAQLGEALPQQLAGAMSVGPILAAAYERREQE